MPRAKAKPRLSSRVQRQTLAQSAKFPRWVVAASVLWIGLMLLLGAISDRDGTLHKPGIGSYLYAAAVVAAALIVARFEAWMRAARGFLARFSRNRTESR